MNVDAAVRHGLSVANQKKIHSGFTLKFLDVLLVSLMVSQSVVAEVYIPADPTRTSPSQLKPIPFQAPEQKEDGFTLPAVPASPLPLSGNPKLVLVRVEFVGNKVLSTKELQALARSFLNHPLNGRDLEDLRQRITFHYVNKGYLNSGAVIPSQSIKNGVLLIKITEGKLTEIRLQGLDRLKPEYVRDRLANAAGSPLNIKTLQQGYQLLLKDPLIERLNGRFLPGTKPGESILDVNVTRARPYQINLQADDYITPSVGGFAGRISGWVSNLSTWGETIDANFLVAEGLLGVNTGLDLPINAYDTHLTFRFSDTFARLLEKKFVDLNIKTEVTGYDLGINHPIYRSLNNEFRVGGNFAVRRDDTTFLSDPNTLVSNFGSSKVTVLRLWQQYNFRGTDDILVFRSTFNKGLDALGSTVNGIKPAQTSDFFNWIGQTQYARRMLKNGAQLVFRGAVQLSDTAVLGLERFSLGGIYSVRGYRENSYVKDNGFYVGLEFRYPLFGGDRFSKHSFNLVPFMDFGGAWNNPNASSINNNVQKTYLHSVGLGGVWHYDKLDTELYWAHPLISQSQNNEHSIQDDGIHFKVSLNAF